MSFFHPKNFFVIKYKFIKVNHETNALSRKILFLVNLHAEIIRFNYFKELYQDDEDFAQMWDACRFALAAKGFHLQDSFLFQRMQLCIPQSSLQNHFENCTSKD